jgi:uncharacterized protein
MPLIDGSEFVPVKRFRNGHYNTFIPALFLPKPPLQLTRHRLITPDDDFIDIDQMTNGSSRAMVICHGLEGNSTSGYMLQFAQYYHQLGWDIIMPNYRGCSGEMNRKLRMYNSGTTDDIHFVLEETTQSYDEVVLVGFSLGGNLILKYLGERVYPIADKVKAGIAISAPIDLGNASLQLLKPENFAYQIRFLNSLIGKIIKKKRQFPNEISLKPLIKTYNLWRFDEYFTAPIYGYSGATDYYSQNSSLQFLDQLERPALLINAVDDPFLSETCYPYELADKLNNFSFCAPQYGGHVGFVIDKNERNWIHDKCKSFLESIV